MHFAEASGASLSLLRCQRVAENYLADFGVGEADELAIPFGGSIADLPEFIITVSFVPQVGLPLVTHTLTGCEFIKDTVKSQEGDKEINVELDLILLDIKGL